MNADTDRLPVFYRGTFGELFGLALWTGFLTFVTLGIYRFWATTRIRRYVWSAIAPGGDPLEYTGTGLERFLGFLVAVVILAAYLSVINLVLFAAGVFTLPGEGGALQLQLALTVSALATLPLVGFALYRARRYKASRTRWRGIRCAMEPGAGGYTWRWLGYTALTALSLGLLLPLQTFFLEKYMADRSWFGDARLHQGGHWTMLYRPLLPLMLGGATVAASIAFAAVSGESALSILLGVGGGLVLFFGAVHYGVQSFRLLTRHKRLGQGICFEARPSTVQVIGIWFLGILVSAGVLLAWALILGLVAAAAGVAVGLAGGAGAESSPPMGRDGVTILFVLGIVLSYIALFLLLAAVQTAFTAQKITAHIASTVSARNIGELDGIAQRKGDDTVDADGFAAALDIGGGF
jgi:uncharacterized membrane protein YjgN (DUF898 family)